MSLRYLTISQSPSEELLDMLSNNIIGTPGTGMLYQHLQVRDKLYNIEDPFFINLFHARRIVGTCCFCSRNTMNHQLEIRSFYIRYFSFRDAFRRKSVHEKERKGRSGLKKEIELVLSGKGLNVKPGEKFLHYAYVDQNNPRSAILCKEFGFETIRQYTTVVFNRINPKKLMKIEEARSVEEVSDLLKKFYDGFNLVSFENFRRRKYFFIRDEQGKPIAGALVNPDQWKIHALPGWSGNLLGNLFSYTPILNRLMNKNFRFITLEGVYCAPGFENYLEKLFETLLHHYKVYSAICVMDGEGKLYSILKSLRLGLINKIRKEVRGNVIARFFSFTEEEKNTFKKSEVYISGIDAT